MGMPSATAKISTYYLRRRHNPRSEMDPPPHNYPMNCLPTCWPARGRPCVAHGRDIHRHKSLFTAGNIPLKQFQGWGPTSTPPHPKSSPRPGAPHPKSSPLKNICVDYILFCNRNLSVHKQKIMFCANKRKTEKVSATHKLKQFTSLAAGEICAIATDGQCD